MGIIERFKRFAEPEQPKPRLGGKTNKELGESGTQNFHGFITEDYNPKFRGKQAIDIYKEMRLSDGTVKGVLTAVKQPILATEYSINPASEDKLHVEQADFIRKVLFEDLESGWRQFRKESLNIADFGFYYFEKVYGFDAEGRIVLKKLAPRLPSAHYKWEMESDPATPGITQMLVSPKGDKTTPEIPFSKLVLLTLDREGDDYGGTSLLRSAYKHWKFKNILYKIDGIRHERGAGILKIRLPKGSTPQDKADAENLGKYFKTNEQGYVVYHEGWEIDIMVAGTGDQGSKLMDSVHHHDRMILQNILAQFLDLGSGSSGSFALSKDQSSFFTLALQSISTYVDEVVNKQIIKELIDLNWGPQEKYPVYQSQKVGQIDFDEMSQVLERLVNIDVVKKDPQLKVWVHKIFGLPDVDLEDFEDDDDDKPAPPTKPGSPPEPGKENEELEKAQKEVEEAELAEGKYFRNLTLAEERVELAEIETFLDNQDKEVDEILTSSSEKQKEQLLVSAEKVIKAGTVAAAVGLTLRGSNKAESALAEVAKASLERGRATAAKELGKVVPSTSSAAKQAVRAKISLLVTKRKNDIETALKSRLVDLVQSGVGLKPALLDVEALVDKQIAKSNARLRGSVVVDALDAGRSTVFDTFSSDIHGLQRSEILDNKTCNMCLTLDSRVLNTNDPFTQVGAIHDHCRGIWVAILKSDQKLPPVKTLPKTLKNRFETAEGVPFRNGFTQLKKPIVKKNSRLEQRIKDGKIDVN